MPILRFRRLSLYVQLGGVRWEMREDEAISHNCGKRITGGYPVVMVMSSNTSALRKNCRKIVMSCAIKTRKLTGSCCTGGTN